MPKSSATPGAHDQFASPQPRTPRLAVAAALACLVAVTIAWAGAPRTDRRAVRDTYHGVPVTEDYRWLEDADNLEVQAWTRAQNEYAREYFDGIDQRDAKFWRLFGAKHVSYYSLKYVGGKFFAMKSLPPHEQPFLVTLESVHDTQSEQVLIDLNTLDTSFTTAIDFYVPSLDGNMMVVSLSRRGSEYGTAYVYDVTTGAQLDDVVPRVNGPTAGGSVAWLPDGSGFYYTRYPHEGERAEEDLSFYQQVYFHRLGTHHEDDQYAIGKEFPRIAEIELFTPPGGRYIVAEVSNGDGGEYAHWLLDPPSGWHRVTEFADSTRNARFGPGGALYLLSYKNAPNGKILRLEPGESDLAGATAVVPESEVAIKEYLATASKIYVADIVGGPSRVRMFDVDGTESQPWPVEEVSSVRAFRALEGDTILFNAASYTQPSAWFEFDPATSTVTKTALVQVTEADYSHVDVTRVFATSRDGTRIPLNILHQRGIELDGSHPTILYSYGGYGISMTPGFSSSRSVWLNQGGIYAIANIRGGGEYGESWHRAGNLTHKQNVFDDFIACAEYLIEAGYTQSSHLAIEGGSNGGLLMGAVLTQRPELYRAVVSHVGVYDMLRVELDPNGEFNTTEFGTVTIPEHFEALYAYSPYHNVEHNTAYPAILLLTGMHDGRVNPAHSFKMAARLQAATSSDHPVLLRTSMQTGHGRGTSLSRQVERYADVYAFLFNELGLTFHTPESEGTEAERGR